MATIRYIVNNEEMDVAAVTWPRYVWQRDSGLGYGDRCWIVETNGAKVEDGVQAVLDVYPQARVTANQRKAAEWCAEKWSK